MSTNLTFSSEIRSSKYESSNETLSLMSGFMRFMIQSKCCDDRLDCCEEFCMVLDGFATTRDNSGTIDCSGWLVDGC